ncbi:unnamed protein product, partial [Prorocentrum cordatum]
GPSYGAAGAASSAGAFCRQAVRWRGRRGHRGRQPGPRPERPALSALRRRRRGRRHPRGPRGAELRRAVRWRPSQGARCAAAPQAGGSGPRQRGDASAEPPAQHGEWACLVASTWPLHVLGDPARQPRAVRSPEEFARALLLEDHLEDVVVLRGGLGATGLEEEAALPGWVTEALDGAEGSVLSFLRGLSAEALSAHKAALEYVDELGVQREVLPRPYPFSASPTARTASSQERLVQA